jgi:integrase
MDTLSRYRTHLLAQGYATDTIAVRVRVVALAAAHADVEPEDLEPDDVEAWITSKPRADWTRIKYLQHLSGFFAWAGLPDATAELRRPRTPIGVPKPVSEVDLDAMLRAAPARTRAWIVLGAFCGLRSFETAKVAAEDLEQAGDGSWLLRIQGKGGQVAVVPCPDVALAELRPWVEAVGGRGELWPGATRYAVQHAIRRVAERVGARCSSHQLRHRYGTAVHSSSGGDLLTTQRLMRHRSPATTAGYAMVAGDRLSAVVAALPGAQVLHETRPRLRLVQGG